MLEEVMRSRALIFALALSLGALTAVSSVHMALHALPFCAVLALLLCGRFVGEERILARRLPAAPPRLRRARARRWTADRPARVSSLFARSPQALRGPPAAAF
jgi:hypothetical protein